MLSQDALRYTKYCRNALTLSGYIRSNSGPAPEISVEYRINGEPFTTMTDEQGRYVVCAREGDHVRIMPLASAQPPRRIICRANSDSSDLDFSIAPAEPAQK